MINLVSISGGKDSTALWLLALERGVKNITPIFADTGHEHEETYQYIEYLEKELGPVRRVQANFDRQIAKKKEYILKHWENDGVPAEQVQVAVDSMVPTGNPFHDLVKWKGRFPSSQVRFCTQELKVFPILDQVLLPLLKEKEQVVSWQGVRADESPSRAKLPMYDIGDIGELIYRPILKWTVDDVFAMHKKHGINPNPLYKQGMGRVGCMPCVNVNKNELAEIAKRFPKEIDRIEAMEIDCSKTAKRGSATFKCITDIDSSAPADANHETHGIRRACEWACTARGGKQQDWLKQMDAPACASNYGLCE